MDDGLTDEAPLSETINTPTKVVVIDALLRKHYVTLTKQEITEVTGLQLKDVDETIENLVESGIVVKSDGDFKVGKQNSQVKSLREYQKDLLGS